MLLKHWKKLPSLAWLELEQQLKNLSHPQHNSRQLWERCFKICSEVALDCEMQLSGLCLGDLPKATPLGAQREQQSSLVCIPCF